MGCRRRRAFNQIGEILPSVIIDGMLAGTWSWNASTASVNVDMIAGRFPAWARRQVNARAAGIDRDAPLRLGTRPVIATHP